MNLEFKNKDIEAVLREVGVTADEMGFDCYVVGGFVRDLILEKSNDDIDFVVVGSGLELAERLAEKHNTKVCLYENYGTAKVDIDDYELEFVGARKEFYHRESRNPIVEDGTLEDDLSRRDFTINAMAICVNADRFGEFIDKYDGVYDLNHKIIRCVGNSDERFSEDPLRMLRCARFAARFGFFTIKEDTFNAIISNRERINIITKERILEELSKMMAGEYPRVAFKFLHDTKLDELILPDGFWRYYTPQTYWNATIALSFISKKTEDPWVRWATLFYQVRDIEGLFKRMGMPLDDRMDKVVTITRKWRKAFHLCKYGFDDAEVRWLIYYAGKHIYDVLTVTKAIIDVELPDNKEVNDLYEKLRKRINDIEDKEHIIDFRTPVDGKEIMDILNIGPCKKVGDIKNFIRDSIMEGDIENNKEQAIELIKEIFNEKEHGKIE